jgi:hypothetical protein
MQPYTGIDGLQDIVLEESYVLGITATPGSVVFTMDFVLTRDHPLFQPFNPVETYECFRRGQLRFQGVKSLQYSDQIAQATQDPDGELDWGHIDYFEWKPGCYRLEAEGDWGIMEITGDNIHVTATVTVDDTDSPA